VGRIRCVIRRNSLPDSKHEFKGGLNLKLLDGFGGAYIKHTDLTYNIVDEQLIVFGPTSVDYGRTNYDSFDPIHKYSDLKHGGGFGWDLGFTYEMLRDSSEWSYEMDCSKWADPIKTNTNSASVLPSSTWEPLSSTRALQLFTWKVTAPITQLGWLSF
jgi:hypothetical protein